MVSLQVFVFFLSVTYIRGVDKFFKTLATLASNSVTVFTRQVTKQLAHNIEMVSKKGKNPRQTGEWVCIITRQA
jgi:hypothetical protein